LLGIIEAEERLQKISIASSFTLLEDKEDFIGYIIGSMITSISLGF